MMSAMGEPHRIGNDVAQRRYTPREWGELLRRWPR